ncbi:hypothetical protein NE237_008344 [Protea cynaroides]|uniref:Uncharacterized protein n=1 Tax=Protea cynaroides TaxID=273540 RepID=A0A9Q0QZL3_9MAGN|nr:hypothetical protein NE237_008344 [Protea cynaroides]
MKRARGTLATSTLGETRPTKPLTPLPLLTKQSDPVAKETCDVQSNEKERKNREPLDKKTGDLAAIPFATVFNLNYVDSTFRKAEIARMMIKTAHLPRDVSFLAILSPSEVISHLFHYIALSGDVATDLAHRWKYVRGNVDHAFATQKEVVDTYNA